ncbi:pinin-like isoform X1 [Macrobrachium nipponense]|uniref:pinin-like isoform X1 n=2 Tax=Macrobrachium nipponense TaxID=159736 RepID=UPI0030C8235B
MAAMSLVSTIQSEIEKAQLNLKDVDENLRKLTGRDFNETNQRPDQRRSRVSSGNRDDEPPAKRRPQGVFARLGGVVLEQHYQESRGRGRGFRRGSDGSEPRGGDGRGDLRAEIHGGGEARTRRVQEVVEEDEKTPKPSLASSVARPQVDFKSRTEAAAELTKDRASRDRNRRMFGALLGTLKRFKNDEAKQKDKEEQRAAIDRKLEEKGRAEKEELRRERLELFNQRKARQAQIRRLTYKMERVKEHEAWEAHMMKLTKFIRTKSSPRIFWLPRSHTSRTTSLVRATHDIISRELEQDRQRLKEDLEDILGSRADDDQGEEGRDAAEEGGEEEEKSFVSRGVRSEVIRQGEGGANDSVDNCADLLDYEAEEGELVYDEADLSGKDNNDTERVVVQVDGRGDGGRKVEIVGSQSLDKVEGLTKVVGGNDSEKENQSRLKEKSKDRDKDRSSDKDRRHRDKGREKDRGKDRDTGKETERDRTKDYLSSREKDKKKDKSRDRNRDAEKEKSKAAAEMEEPHLPDLEATIVHIKIEKDDDDFNAKEPESVSKAIKEEKADKSNTTVEEDKTTSVVDLQPDGELPPSPTIADFPLPSDSPSPPRAPATASSPAVATSTVTSNPAPASSPKAASPPPVLTSPPIPKSPPLPPKDSSETTCPSQTLGSAVSGKEQSAVDASKEGKEEAGEAESKKKGEAPVTHLDINPGDIQLPEGNPIKPAVSADSKKSSKHKPVKEDKKVSDRGEKKKKGEKKGGDKHSGSSDDSSSDESSSSSSGSSESDSSDSESSSSSSDSSSGSSSDSESDSSSSTSSDSEAGGQTKKKQKRKRRGSRSGGNSSSDSEKEGKPKKKRKYDQSKKDTKKKDTKVKVEQNSDDDKLKKSSASKDKKKEKDGEKGKDKEANYKSRDKDRERDASRRQEREKGRNAGRSKSREKKKDRSKSRDRNRRDRSRSRDNSRRDRKERR